MMRAPRVLLLALLAGALAAGARPAAAQFLYWTDTHFGAPTLNRCKPDGTARITVALPYALPEGLAIDTRDAKLVLGSAAWTGAGLYSANLDFTFPATVLPGLSTLHGVAADNVGQYLFFASSNLVTGSAIGRVGVNGTGYVQLLNLGPLANPRGVALDPLAGKVYWADFDQNALYSTTFGGGAPVSVATLAAGSRPFGVALDPVAARIYWTEYGAGTVRSAPLGGGAATTLVTGLGNPTYLVVDHASNYMYWSEAATGAQRIQRARLDGTLVQNLGQPVTTYGGLALATGSVLDAPAADAVLDFALGAPTPNPAHGLVRLEVALPRESALRATVLDVQGREVALLADGVRPAGRHALEWRANGAAPGLYFVRVQAGTHRWTRRVTVTR